MKIKYDEVAKALYIEVGKDGVILNTAELAQNVFADYSEEHKLLGIEILNVEKKDIENLL